MPTRRVLKSVAHNLLDSLLSWPYGRRDGSILTHLAKAAHMAKLPSIQLDILRNRVLPEQATTEALSELAATAKARLQELVIGVGLGPSVVTEALIQADMLLPAEPGIATAGAPSEPNAVTVTLRDDRGHQHIYRFRGGWFTQTEPAGSGPPRRLPSRGVQDETPVTRLLAWLEQFLPRL